MRLQFEFLIPFSCEHILVLCEHCMNEMEWNEREKSIKELMH